MNECYIYQANYLVKFHNGDQIKALSDCMDAPARKDYCILGVGTSLASLTVLNFPRSAMICGTLSEFNDANACVSGAVASISSRYGGAPEKIIEYCNAVDLKLREVCFAKLGGVVFVRNEGEKESICAATNYKEACLGRSSVKARF